MNGSEFVFDYVHLFHLLYYKYPKINPNRGESYIGSPDWIKMQQLIPSIKKITNVFNTLYSLNHEEIKKD